MLGILITYMSKVNFIFVSRSPMKILVKLSTNDLSVTYSLVAGFGFLRLMGVFLGAEPPSDLRYAELYKLPDFALHADPGS